MDRANEAMQHFYCEDRRKLDPIWRIINRRCTKQLQPLHVGGVRLEPQVFSIDEFELDEKVMDGLREDDI